MDDDGNPKPRKTSSPLPNGVAKAHTHMVRLSKRCSELNLCSRREADEILNRGKSSKVRIFVDGEDVTKHGVGYKIPADCSSVHIGAVPKAADVLNPDPSDADPLDATTDEYLSWESRGRETIILNKPTGYVTGLPRFAAGRGSWTHSVPLGPSGGPGGQTAHAYKACLNLVHEDTYYHGGKSYTNPPSPHLVRRLLSKEKGKGLAPAGRLDIGSSGLVIMTRDGVIAKLLVGEGHRKVEKEYVVTVCEKGATRGVDPRSRARKDARLKKNDKVDSGAADATSAQRPNLKRPLQPLLLAGTNNGADTGGTISRPIASAAWIGPDKVRVVMGAGQSKEFRRVVEETLGLEVRSIRRVRVGPVMLGKLPVGKWRFLSKREGEELLANAQRALKV